MGKTAFIFPGQGSQFVGMGKELYDNAPTARTVFQQADEALGYSLTDIMFNGPEETLTQTEYTQPALLTMSSALHALVEERGVQADYTAGHSLGEYSALVANGALKFADTASIVAKRGKWMAEADPDGKGTMAAVMGMEREDLQELADEATEAADKVQLANLNAPGQIVISGSREGVRYVEEHAPDRGAKKVVPLQVSGPFHSSFMKPAEEKLAEALQNVEIRGPRRPLIANVDAKETSDPSAIRQQLIAQVTSPVHWEDSVRRLIDLGVTEFVEIGPGNVLSGMIRRIQRRGLDVHAVQDEASLDKWLEKRSASS